MDSFVLSLAVREPFEHKTSSLTTRITTLTLFVLNSFYRTRQGRILPRVLPSRQTVSCSAHRSHREERHCPEGAKIIVDPCLLHVAFPTGIRTEEPSANNRAARRPGTGSRGINRQSTLFAQEYFARIFRNARTLSYSYPGSCPCRTVGRHNSNPAAGTAEESVCCKCPALEYSFTTTAYARGPSACISRSESYANEPVGNVNAATTIHSQIGKAKEVLT
jgi:hypothetical protein